MHYTFKLVEAALDDLEQLWDTNEAAAAELEEWLAAFEEDQDLLETLSVHDYGAYQLKPYHVDRWEALYNRPSDRDVWRLRIWSGACASYRTIYGFQAPKQRYWVLGFPHRDFDYSLTHPTTIRMVADYDSL